MASLYGNPQLEPSFFRMCAPLRVSSLYINIEMCINRWKPQNSNPSYWQFFSSEGCTHQIFVSYRAILAWPRWQTGGVNPGLPVSSHPQQTWESG